MPFNGEPRELTGDESLDDEMVYCVACGTVFVYGDDRDCPTCTVHEEVESLKASLNGRLDSISNTLGDIEAHVGDAVMERAADVLDGEDLEIFHAIRRSDAHPDLARYYVKAVQRDHTGLVSSLRTFHGGSGVQRIAEVGTRKEKILYNEGAVAAVDKISNWDVTNESILKEIAAESHDVQL